MAIRSDETLIQQMLPRDTLITLVRLVISATLRGLPRPLAFSTFLGGLAKSVLDLIKNLFKTSFAFEEKRVWIITSLAFSWTWRRRAAGCGAERTYATDSLKATAISLAMSSGHVTYAATTAERYDCDGCTVISLV